MKFKAIWKDTFREISKSKMRFLAILIIIFLGVGFYVGISATSPDMILTSDEYFSKLNLMDYRVQSTYGLTEEDVDELENMDGVAVQSHYAHDFVVEENASTIRLYSLDLANGQEINQYYLEDGRLPNQPGEIALDNKLRSQGELAVGDTLSLQVDKDSGDPEEFLERSEFEVVGFVNSPMFIENASRGTSSIGSGSLNGFGVISEADYDTDIYTEAYLTIEGSENYQAFSEEYDNFAGKQLTRIETTLDGIEKRREENVLDEIQTEIDDGWAQIEEAEQELADAEVELQEARAEIDDGWAEFVEGRQTLDEETSAAEAEINRNEQQLREGLQELETNQQQLVEQRASLQTERANLDDNEQPLLDGIAQIEQGIPQLESGIREIDQNLPELNAGIEQIDAEIQQLEAQKAQLEQALEMPEADVEEIQAQIAPIDAGLATLEEQRQPLSNTRNELTTQREALASQLSDLQSQLMTLRTQEQQLVNGRNQIDSGLSQINEGLAEIETARIDIQNGFTELEAARNTLANETENAQAELAEAEATLDDAEVEYLDGFLTFTSESQTAREELEDGRLELEELEEDLENLPMPVYYLFDRADNLGYSEYKDNADRLSIIAMVFPGFFFLIAIFISFTTMTRMVDEEREYIGIMKALGYENRYILIKFITYATLATTVGAILGLIAGYTLIPQLIFYAYSSMYNFPETVLEQFTRYTVIALFASFISTVGASLLAVRYSLRSNAGRLLQPKAPRHGTRIWLERIPFIWKRLSFNYKITFRNVFRYKSRMFMTILGIAGSTGLILTGFGISDSISDIPSIQYGEINQFQAYVALDPNIESDELEDYREATQGTDSITHSLFVSQESVTAEKENINTQDITLFVPEEPENIGDFISLTDSEDEDIIHTMDDSGAYITQKIAQLLELDVGDEMEVINSDEEVLTINVAGISENYIGHFAYMTPEYYQAVTGNGIDEPSIQLIKYDEETTDETVLGSQLMEEDEVVGISYVADVYNAFSGTLNSLDLITQILVIAAAALAFIVLYNLTNINVSERNRELSTIKVLGSHDHEVTMYIYRENIILSVLGILVGLGFGTLLTNFIMATMEVDMLVFGRAVHLSSYLYSTLLTILFSLVVMIVIHFQLKRIDMVEALKAND